MAAKAGGPDPSMNPALRLVVDKAKAANMPNDNVERAIKKATSAVDETNYDEITYEGYGPGGVGILVHALTDNRNRTATNVRVAFTRNGGSLGETGSVSYLFDRKGYIAIERDGLTVDEETMFEDVLEAGQKICKLLLKYSRFILHQKILLLYEMSWKKSSLWRKQN